MQQHRHVREEYCCIKTIGLFCGCIELVCGGDQVSYKGGIARGIDGTNLKDYTIPCFFLMGCSSVAAGMAELSFRPIESPVVSQNLGVAVNPDLGLVLVFTESILCIFTSWVPSEWAPTFTYSGLFLQQFAPLPSTPNSRVKHKECVTTGDWRICCALV